MLSQTIHKERVITSRLNRVIKNIWIHSRSEQWDEPIEKSIEERKKSALYLLTHQRHIQCDEMEQTHTKERDEILKQLRLKHEVSNELPVSVFTKHTTEYCEETKKTYSNEHTYYNSPPGQSFLGSI